LNSGLWVRRLLIGGSPFQGQYPASEVNDGGCPEKPDHLTPRFPGPSIELGRPWPVPEASRQDAAGWRCSAKPLVLRTPRMRWAGWNRLSSADRIQCGALPGPSSSRRRILAGSWGPSGLCRTLAPTVPAAGRSGSPWAARPPGPRISPVMPPAGPRLSGSSPARSTSRSGPTPARAAAP
jgi:hypothetical protein